uniref:Leucine-rich repeat protein n=1 Tax=Paramoeba aestuarina TaxID=180227 RepID=A0A7S4UQ14_9EUKA|mmetsp:Transcript_6251/g.9466  ORF Transcript_6251/g.9466 Transcript_6251/m.9466 type:complete len:303 (+) Transcript_6251:31-939(+)
MAARFACLVLSSDSATLGRLDYASLSQQTLLEMVIDGITFKQYICREDEGTSEIQNWIGLTFNNEDETLIEVDWSETNTDGPLEGSISLEWLPATVKKFDLRVNRVEGSANLTHLPEALKSLDLSENHFAGEIKLDSLPEHIEELLLHENVLTGPLNLTSLPDSLRELNLGGNHFSGSVDLTGLPESMKILVLAENQLSGAINLMHLPHQFSGLLLAGNKFEGETDFSKIPQSMEDLDITNNIALSGTILLSYAIDFKAEFCAVQVFEPMRVIDANIPGTTLLSIYPRDDIREGDHAYFVAR